MRFMSCQRDSSSFRVIINGYGSRLSNCLAVQSMYIPSGVLMSTCGRESAPKEYIYSRTPGCACFTCPLYPITETVWQFSPIRHKPYSYICDASIQFSYAPSTVWNENMLISKTCHVVRSRPQSQHPRLAPHELSLSAACLSRQRWAQG